MAPVFGLRGGSSRDSLITLMRSSISMTELFNSKAML